MKQCNSCGAEMPDAARFCPNCGTSFTEPEPQTQILSENTEFELTQTAPVEAWEPDTPQTASEETFSAPTEPECAPQPMEPFTPFPQTDMSAMPQKKKRKLWPWLLGGAVLVLAAAALLLYFFVWNSPARRVGKAMEKTGDALHAQFENCENLLELGDVCESLAKQKALSYTVKANASADGVYVDATFQATGGDKTLDADLNFDVDAFGERIVMALSFAVDDERLQIELPDLTGQKFHINFDTMEEDLKNSPLATSIGDMDELVDAMEEFQKYMDTNGQQATLTRDEFFKKAEYVEERTEKRKIGGAERECTYYRMENAAELLGDEMYDDVWMLVDDRGYLVGVQVTLASTKDMKEIETLYGIDLDEKYTILLDGEKNPCSRLTVWQGDDEVLAIEIEKTENGCAISADDVVLEIDDEKRCGTLYVDGEEFTLAYQFEEEQGEPRLSLEMGYEVEDEATFRISVVFTNAEDVPVLSDDGSVNILTMNQEDAEAVLADIVAAVAENEDYAWLGNLLGLTPDLTGTWYTTVDFTTMLYAAGMELPFEIELEEPPTVLYLTFHEDGTCQFSLDEAMFVESMSAFRAALVEPMTEYMYELMLEEGVDREAADAAFVEAYGMTIKEYAAQSLEALEISTADIVGGLSDYTFDGETVWIDDVESYSYVDSMLISTEPLVIADGDYLYFEKVIE